MDHPQILCAALYLLTLFKFSSAADTLSANQTLADGDVLISPSQIYEFGFFSPGSSTSRFLGVWYKATPDVVVWVANRQEPITGLNGVLTLSKNGNLNLNSAQGTNIWSSNSSTSAASSPFLQLLSSGNLVIVQDSAYIWQSFDYPGDTRIPGMKLVQDFDSGESKYFTSWKSGDDPSMGVYSYRIENYGLSQTVILKGEEKVNRVVFWNGNFVGYPISHDPAWTVEVVTNKGRLVSVTQPFYDSVIARLTMNYTGSLQRYVMNEKKDGWILMISLPHDLCDGYGVCGQNGICKIYKNPVCECLRGFEPKSESEWSVFDWKGGCTRNHSLDCQKEEGFLEVKGIKFPDSLNFRLNTSTTRDECRDECFKNCNCTAYTDPYFNNGSSCMMWFGDLIDMREYTTESGPAPSIYIRVPISELDQNKRKGPPKTTVIAIVVASCLGMLILGLSCWAIFVRKRRKKQERKLELKKTGEDLELPLFDLTTIETATNYFSIENMIGEGGFGPVYKGNLSSGEVIAVKRMSKISGQGHEEFKTEINLIAKLQHRNLVRIFGCCVEGEEKMLIYEYMMNRSLDHFIFDQQRRAMLNWPKRFDIIMGIARGLLYLHHDSRLNVIHRDLKASNILLDRNLNAKISDFGLARMFEGDQTISTTTRVVGTYGYMAPEYAFDGKFSIKSDVYSLGVVILEIVSGQKNRGFKPSSSYKNLLEQAWHYCKEGRELELMDPCYKFSYVESQVKRCVQVGSLCVQNEADVRPMMPSVVLMLSSEDAVLPQPRKPGFFLHGGSSFSHSNASGSKASTGGAVTITDIEAR